MLSVHKIGCFLGTLALAAAQSDPFTLCKDSVCTDCPASVVSAGTGYNSDDIFKTPAFPIAKEGGYEVYFDIQQQDPGCATIIKSPAGTNTPGCGYVKGAFNQPACARIPIEKTFMVQFCCGNGDCKSAGAGRKMIRGLNWSKDLRSVTIGGGGGVYLKDSNGTIITPAEVGPPPELQQAQVKNRGLQKRACTKDSWKPSGETYTRPADNVQIMSANVDGGTTGGQITVTTERSQSYTTTLSLGIADILSLGVEQSFTESISRSTAIQVPIPAGQSGKLGFTAFLTCSKGEGTCDDGSVSGEVCWPTPGPDDDVAGIYAVIITG